MIVIGMNVVSKGLQKHWNQIFLQFCFSNLFRKFLELTRRPTRELPYFLKSSDLRAQASSGEVPQTCSKNSIKKYLYSSKIKIIIILKDSDLYLRCFSGEIGRVRRRTNTRCRLNLSTFDVIRRKLRKENSSACSFNNVFAAKMRKLSRDYLPKRMQSKGDSPMVSEQPRSLRQSIFRGENFSALIA